MSKKIEPFSLSERIEKISLWIIIITICLSGVFYNYQPLQDFIKKTFFPPKVTDQGVFITYVSSLVGLLLIIIFRIGNKSEKLIRSIEESKEDFDGKLFLKGTSGIYEDVDQEINERRTFGQIAHIDILGYTLFSVAPKLEEWKSQGKLTKMVLNLYHLDQNYIKSSSDINDSMALQLVGFLDEIRNFLKANSKYMRENKVRINLIPYSHIPAVHGFKLGNGSIYMSLAFWDESLQLAPPNYRSAYLKIDNNDKSRFATEIRDIFENWTLKAKSKRVSA